MDIARRKHVDCFSRNTISIVQGNDSDSKRALVCWQPLFMNTDRDCGSYEVSYDLEGLKMAACECVIYKQMIQRNLFHFYSNYKYN